ncbi:MAG TPA: hypothetical protein VFV66_24065 [Nonomuraea sp.]|nr:hypothetical protein [Nonomuraea sp.]
MAKPNSAAGIAGFLAKPPTPPRSPRADDLGGVPEDPGAVATVPARPESVDGKPVPQGAGINKFVDASALPIAQALSDGREPTLEDCEQQIVVVTNQWLIAAADALARIHDGELWRQAKGIIYDSWKGYLQHRHNMSPQRAHQLMKARRSAAAVAPVAQSEIKEGHTRVLEKIFEQVGQSDLLPDEAAAKAACRKVWMTAAGQSGRPSAAALERAAVREGYIAAPTEDRKPPALPPADPPAWQRVAPAVAVAQDLGTLKALMEDAPAKGFEVAFYFMRAAHEMANDLGDQGRKTLEQAVMDGELPDKLDF